MKRDTVNKNVDTKIQEYLNKDMPLSDIISRLKATKENFEKIALADSTPSPRTETLNMYIEHSEKRIKDLTSVKENFALQ